MPLDAAGLKSDIKAIADDAPATVLAAAQAWAQAAVFYAGSVVPASTTVSAAGATLQSALASAFGTTSAAAPMETALAAFATTVAGGMAGAGFAGTPPAGAVGFAGLFAVTRETTEAAADAVSAAIDAWMKTGTAVPLAGGAAVLWA
jgi:hypothetical protein